MPKIKVTDMIPHPENEYYFDNIVGEQFEELCESIKTSGFLQKPLLTDEMVIVAGHQRRRVAMAIGIEEIDCDIRHYDSEDQVVKDMIESNTTGRWRVEDSSVKKGRRFKKLKEIAGIKAGNNQRNRNNFQSSEKEIAEQFGVSVHTMDNFESLTTLTPELAAMVDKEISATAAFKIASQLKTEAQQMEFYEKIKDLPIGQKITQKVTEEYIAKIQEAEHELQVKEQELTEMEAKLERQVRKNAKRDDSTKDELIGEIDNLKLKERKEYERAETYKKEAESRKAAFDKIAKAHENQKDIIESKDAEIEELRKQLEEKQSTAHKDGLGDTELIRLVAEFNTNLKPFLDQNFLTDKSELHIDEAIDRLTSLKQSIMKVA